MSKDSVKSSYINLLPKNIFEMIKETHIKLQMENKNITLDDFLSFLMEEKWNQKIPSLDEVYKDLETAKFSDILNFIFDKAKTNPFIDLNNLETLF